MDEASIIRYITDTFEGVEVATHENNSFFALASNNLIPFATLVTGDDYETVSNLSRPSVYRLNFGVGKESFRSIIGTLAPDFDTNGDYDFTALDTIMPHPTYGKMRWLCVLNPSVETFEKMKPLLAEAYELASKRATPREETEG